jgi:CheY-like chemotaxis protein
MKAVDDRKPLVLVVDDNEDNRIVFTSILEHAAYPTLSASNGLEGIAKARQHRPTVMVLDARMPGLFGGEVARQLTADPVTATIRLIAVTADLTYTAEEARRDGFCAYLTLPLVPDHLRRAVDFCIADDGWSSGSRWIKLPAFTTA